MFLGVPTNIGLGSVDLQDLFPGVLGERGGGQDGQAEAEYRDAGAALLHRSRLLVLAGRPSAMTPALNILHVLGPVFTRAQTAGCRPQKPATSSVDMTMKAVDRASEAAAEGCEAQAAACPPAGRPVRGSTIWAPLTSVPEPLRARLRRRTRPGPDRAPPAGPRADGPALIRRRSSPVPGPAARAVLVPAWRRTFPIVPIPENGQGRVEGIALADGPEIEVEADR